VLGRWFDPIERKWHTPRAPRVEPPSSSYETDEQKGYRLAHQNRVWDALVSTAQASQQSTNAPCDIRDHDVAS
jgi:hypothetical protein